MTLPSRKFLLLLNKAALAGILMYGLSSINAIGQTAVGFNVASFSSRDFDLAPTDSVGVVPTANWNNLYWESGSSSPLFTDLVDSDGNTIVGMNAQVGGSAFNYPNNTPVDGSVTMPDAIMMKFAKGSSGTGSRTFLVENAPFELYDVYVYFGGSGSSASTPYNMNVRLQEDVDGTWTDVSPTYIMTDSDHQWSGTYTRSTSTVAGTDSNYVVFENVDLSTFRIASSNVGRRAGLSGFQIVAIPEPGYYALGFALFTAGVVYMRRKRTA
ncbi:hypothetical protein [Cerasicoccus arenae]|uniref:Uncharacterized protein n=1 Tax=Cerasicoccus arenae TaxID=424488 RepID=A0A8J3D9G2_9BACT|nr:hypothetical protein [Cerasicoccus arenae]MBK1859586.1 hypothetical protein [Cerasicoccus arenae]GHB92875.1 hypothetical protein GCM10007047_05250 [Cerasicoccus arenae]